MIDHWKHKPCIVLGVTIVVNCRVPTRIGVGSATKRTYQEDQATTVTGLTLYKNLQHLQDPATREEETSQDQSSEA